METDPYIRGREDEVIYYDSGLVKCRICYQDGKRFREEKYRDNLKNYLRAVIHYGEKEELLSVDTYCDGVVLGITDYE